MAIAETAHIYSSVSLGATPSIGEFVVVGVLPSGRLSDDLETRIGDNAVIRSHSVIYAGNQIGRDFMTGHSVLIREENRIGDNVSVGSHSVIEHHVRIADNVRIHSQAFIPEFSILDEGCWIGPNVVFTNARYPLSPGAKENLKGPIVRSGAKIGANSTLLPGVIIGKDALVGAGAVVVGDVAPGKVVAGNPASVIGDVSELGIYDLE